MVQLSLTFRRNSNLFSNHYLETLIKENSEWKEDEATKKAFEQIKKIYEKRKYELPKISESWLEDIFIRPVLEDVLGHCLGLQEKVDRSAKRPDYAFFPDEASLKEAIKNKGKDDFYIKAIAVGDAKSWEKSLDKQQKSGRVLLFEDQNPSFQIDTYLRETNKKWGILSNGRYWRIYHRETSYKLEYFYEIDLVTLIEKGDIESQKYFYLFFRREALTPDATGKCFLDRVYEGSVAYAKVLSDNLQDNVYKAMKLLAEGFLNHPDNGLKKSENDVTLVQENSLKFLYRLLFILYAESRDLLNVKNQSYEYYSLSTIKKEVANKIDKKETIPRFRTDYWSRLDGLFKLINFGTEHFKELFPRKELYIPPYNGGLFDPDRNPFLKEKKIDDYYLAQAIDLLSRSDGNNGEGKGFVDYSSLEIRHLGSIYEGLLEYKLRVADQELVAVKEKGKETWIPKSQFQGKKILEEIKAGDLYLVTDRGERKATGSYYTPDYIVKYIVNNTLEPILEHKKQEWSKDMTAIRFWEKILEIKVLDPAMGSGHFLVEAIDFLAPKLILAKAEARPEQVGEKEPEMDIHWAKREVARHCIFGVDLNPMAVELAKLSIWLSTVAANKPLTFLDHHLRCGNSLIGAKLKDLVVLPDVSGKRKVKREKQEQPPLWRFVVQQNFDELLKGYADLAKKPDDDLKTVHEKTKKYEELQKSELNKRLHEVANVWLSTYFGNTVPEDEYAELQNQLNPKQFLDWDEWRKKDWFQKAQKIAEEKHFFHWELEFLEVFYEQGMEKENAGFDAVVGNPPYVSSVGFLEVDREFFLNRYKTAIKRFDIYNLFCEISLSLLHNKGFNSFILPYPILNQNYSEKLRKIFLEESKIHQIVDLSETKVFKDALVRNCVLVLEKDVDQNQCFNNTITIYKINSNNQINSISSISQRLYLTLPKYMFRIDVSFNLLNIFKKIDMISIKAVEICYIARGAVIHSEIENKKKDEYIGKIKINESFKPYIEGEDIDRYSIVSRNIFLEYKPSIQYRPAFPELFENEKLLIYKVTGEKGLIIAYDNMNFYNNESLYNCILKYLLKNAKITESHGHSIKENEIKISKKYNIKYILLLFNSTLLNIIYQKLYGYELNVYPDDIKNLPIRRISFTTSTMRRAALVDEVKVMYSEFAGAPDSRKLLDFVSSCLEAKPEESDVVHDLLAYLAERMIEMNKEKNNEIKGFLNWLESEISANIDELSSKTKIKEYYKHDFNSFLETLAKNKNKFKGYDPTRREERERLLSEYNVSISKLNPLMEKIKATDQLIDQIVYKLYGLTDQEIEIVERSILE